MLATQSVEEFEHALTEIAVTLINLRSENINAQIENALRCLVLSLGFDRATLVQLVCEERIPLATHCWAREGYPIRTGYSFAEQFPYVYKLMSQDCLPQFFPTIDAIPESEVKTRLMLRQWGPPTMFCLPLNAEGKTIGWITMGTFSIKKISQEIIKKLSILASIFVGVLFKNSYVTSMCDHLMSANSELQKEIDSVHDSNELIGESRVLRAVVEKIEQVAASNSTVLILGETGTGKELVARKIHALSSRRNRAILSVNCAGLSPGLIEAELFGCEKGAFTGAVETKKGRFEVADGSSLFLDEVGELPVTAQAKLLRVIQERQFERIGSARSLTADVRILAATNRDLSAEIQQGKFREDLFYRLNVFPIHVPPLRERLEDIPLMVETFVQTLMVKMGKNIKRIRSVDIKALQSYEWPGNVRELRNVVERALILAKGPLLSIPVPIRSRPDVFTPLTLVELERNHILATLQNTNWRVSGPKGAAKLLDINPKTLESRMRRLGITRPPQLPPDEYFDKKHLEPDLVIKVR